MPEQVTPRSDAPQTGLFPPSGPAWTDDKLADPHAQADKAGRVQRMFAAIARSYDLNNRVHSLGRDQAWRRFAVRKAGVRPGDAVLDVACGTGDLTQLFAATPASSVVGLDFTPQMLDIARDKQKLRPKAHADKLRYIEGDAQNLPFPDASFDVVSIAFGIRNVAEPAKALAQFARVLRPAGRLIVLEFDRPRTPPVSWLNDFYCGWVMPRTATLLSGDRSGAYRYLPKSVATFTSREEFASRIAHAGFSDVSATPLTLGICVCYRAVRSGSTSGTVS